MVDDTDINEISSHIKSLINHKKNKIDDTNIDELPRWEEVSNEAIISKEIKNEQTVMTKNFDINLETRKCDLCDKTMNLEENLSGLVIDDTHFLCEDCCQDTSNIELDIWTSSKMASPGDLKPIALWLMKKKNKNSLF